MAMPTCRTLFEHVARLAASRTFCTAGTSSAIRMAMIAITTSSSISVNADRRSDGEGCITEPFGEDPNKRTSDIASILSRFPGCRHGSGGQPLARMAQRRANVVLLPAELLLPG